MNRIDVHNHLIPFTDDGCQSYTESLICLRAMAAHGYDRLFCTPHCGTFEFSELAPSEIAERLRALQGQADAVGIRVQLKPGGEIRLNPNLLSELPDGIVPTFGFGGKYALVDTWEPDWPAWATPAIQWIQSQGITVILAHPERMQWLRDVPERIDDLAALGLLFQGNLGPLGGGDSFEIVELSRRYLREGRYFMVGTDAHRPNQMPARFNGLKVIEDLMGSEKLHELTVTNPQRLWDSAK